MRIGRRELLAGAATAALFPVAAFARRELRAKPAGALPMPATLGTLPPPLPVKDPSRLLMDAGWLFHDGDIVPPMPVGHDATYRSVKAGNAAGAAAIDFDDSDWLPVDLPHDWASAQPFVEAANASQGYRPRGIGWYRRTLRLEPDDIGKKIELQFGAIATHATLWVNGSVVAHNWSGYNSLYCDITPLARYGDQLNTIAVRVDASAMEGWWYEGAGIYRHVWLAKRPAVGIVTDGVHCDPRRAADGAWSVPVAVTLENIGGDAATLQVVAVLADAGGRVVARSQAQAAVGALDRAEAGLVLPVAAPDLWSVERPTLYTLTVRADGDERRVAIGFREIRFDADRGFFLNDRPVKLKGVCIHQDHAGVGVAVPDTLLAWRLQRLKDMGVNAIRCSHNAPAAEFLDLCDRMGFLVMNENRLFNPAPDYMAQLEWLVRRDRNHPSIILWSVFNEEPMQGTPAGVEMVRRMAHAVDALDGSRPVTAAMNGAFFDPVNVMHVVDVGGFNYYQGDYDRFHALNPKKPITSSEDTSAFETRGAFASDPEKHIITSYDEEAASWGETHRKAWKWVADRPFVAGQFVWTGFDYHGEPTPYQWPTIASFFGAMDLCGFPKTAYDIHRAHWIDDAAVVSIAPHWTWPGREGQPIKILVMSNAERVELLLNGKLVGEAAVDRIMGNEWTVPYAPGRIEAVAYRDGRAVARAVHETCGTPVALRLTPARSVMAGDGEDVQPVTVDAIDAAGRHVPTANLMTHFAINGGTIVGLGNGDNNSHEAEKGDARSLFNGLAQVIMRADVGLGIITIRAAADGLKPATLRIDRIAATPRPGVAVTPAVQRLDQWRRSPAFVAPPPPGLAPRTDDNNSWAFVRAGTATPVEATVTWRVYRTAVVPRRRTAAQGGTIAFARIAGRATLWIDGTRVATKDAPAPGPLTAPLTAGNGLRTIVLIVEATAGTESGLVGSVTVSSR